MGIQGIGFVSRALFQGKWVLRGLAGETAAGAIFGAKSIDALARLSSKNHFALRALILSEKLYNHSVLP